MTQSRPLTAIESKVMNAIIAAADGNRVCPSNEDFCDLVGFSGPAQASNTISNLVKKGKISIRRRPTSRIVTILETGKITLDDPTPRAIRRQQYGSKPGPKPAHLIAANRVPRAAPPEAVTRDPCVGCGVPHHRHAEHGCRRWRYV